MLNTIDEQRCCANCQHYKEDINHCKKFNCEMDPNSKCSDFKKLKPKKRFFKIGE